ncbi:MAG: biotin/lipoyl-binding protein [Candidatus Peribacteraceae bacterium]|nr:biotin/lipoyl-binding protein [Candidatus Peribacteraceae bacterium]
MSTLPIETPVLPLSRWQHARQRMLGFLHEIRIRSYVMGITVVIVIGSSYFVFANGESETSTVTSNLTLVERGNIITSVESTGTVTFANEQKLKFNTKGTVAKVNVKEGDTVKKGQVIAELDKTSAQADVTTAALALTASRLQTEQLKAEREADAMTAQNTVNSAKRSVEQASADLKKTRATELHSLASTVQDIMIGGEKLLDSFYGVLTNNTVARPPSDITTLDINRYLFRDWTLKDQVEVTYREAVNQTTALRQNYGTTLTSEDDVEIVMQALEDSEELAVTLQNLSELTYNMLQGATTDSIAFTVDELATHRSTINSNRSTAAGYVESAQTAQASLVALTNEESIPSTTLQTKEDALTAYEETEAVKQLDLQNTLKNLDLQILLKENEVSQKGTSLSKLKKTLEDYQIKAPFDGTVRRVDYQVGDNLLADSDEAQYIILENREYTIVTILLDQVDIVRVKVGLPAVITLDAIENRVFSGSIFEIDSTPVTSSSVVSYNVDIRIPTPTDVTILSGMTAAVEIETARKEDVLIVPNLALKWTSGKAAVQMASGESTAVETGITDGEYTEILSGLEEGDSLLSVNVSTSNATSSAKGNSMQIMRTLNGGGGGGPPPM